MHNTRLFILVGVGITVTGLFLKTLRTAGEGLLPTLSQASSSFPDGIPTIWGAFSLWAQFLLVVVLAGVSFLALRPNHSYPLDVTEARIAAVAGFAVLAYSLSEWLTAMDQADALETGFIAAAQAGIISIVFTVTASSGYVIVLAGLALVVSGAILSLRSERIGSLRI